MKLQKYMYVVCVCVCVMYCTHFIKNLDGCVNSFWKYFYKNIKLEHVFPKPILICTKAILAPSVPINGPIPLSKRPISFSILCRTPWSCIPNVPRSLPETHWVSMFECVFHSLDRLLQYGREHADEHIKLKTRQRERKKET